MDWGIDPVNHRASGGLRHLITVAIVASLASMPSHPGGSTAQLAFERVKSEGVQETLRQTLHAWFCVDRRDGCLASSMGPHTGLPGIGLKPWGSWALSSLGGPSNALKPTKAVWRKEAGVREFVEARP